MASFASSATTGGACKHAWTNWDPVYERKHGLISVSIHLFQTTTNHDSQSTDEVIYNQKWIIIVQSWFHRPNILRRSLWTA